MKHKVYISCTTFNHVGYIEDAMNGFAMQQTDFPFVVVITDDASTDGTVDVITHYLQDHFELDKDQGARHEETSDYLLTYARHKDNHNCYFAVYLLKYNHYSIHKTKTYFKPWTEDVPYCALCEGDDYWTRPEKLQTQVDFLEQHPDYQMCFHDVDIKAEEGRQWYDVYGKLEDRDYTGLENMLRWSVPTCSIVMRMPMYLTRPANKNFTMGDNVLILHCSRNGKIRCIARKMGVYRLSPTSWIGGQSYKVQRYKYISHYRGLIEEFEECRCEPMYQQLEGQYFQLLTVLKQEGDKAEFDRVRQEYLAYPGTTHWHQFRSYYLRSRVHDTLKSLLGESIAQKYRDIKHAWKQAHTS